MSMSSMIDDLPGPQPELDPEPQQSQQQLLQETEMFTQPTMEIKKKPPVTSPVINIRNEFNTFNVLLIVILYIATMPESNDLIRKLLSNFSKVGYSHMVVTIIKCILLVIVFIIIKKLLGKNTILF